MKKSILLATLALSVLTACSTKPANNDAAANTSNEVKTEENKEANKRDKTIVVGASPSPHAEILENVKEILKNEGYELKIVEYTDYVQPNNALEAGDLDANYFQHKPYLDDFNEQFKTHLVSVAGIHYEPFGIYAGKCSSIDQLQDKAQVAVPNDTTNEARALLLLEAQGLIKLKEGAGLNATKQDIVENTKNLDIVEIEAAQLPLSLQDVDLAVINGNYAIDAGLKVKDALVTEDAKSLAAETYANIVVVKEGNENNEKIKALVNALEQDSVRDFMINKYEGAVVPTF